MKTNSNSTQRRSRTGPRTTLIGSIVLLFGLVSVYVSYNATRGLPFVTTYEVLVEVPDAARLVEGGSEVRIGGARVGLVQQVTAMPGRGGKPPFSELRLSLDKAREGLPSDTRVTVRPRSLLGAKYLDVQPGRSQREIPNGGTLPLANATPVVEVSDTFAIFGKDAVRGLQDSIASLGDGLAGRGPALNQTFAETYRLLPPLQRILRALRDRDTDLAGFLDGFAATTSALRPVAARFGGLFDHAATTLTALDAAGPALGDAIAELPPTESVGTRALAHLTPVLDDAAAIARDIRPATAILPAAARDIADGVRDSTPALRRIPELRRPLEGTLGALDRLVRDPATVGAVRKLTETVVGLRPVLDVLLPAQVHCNVLGLNAANTGATTSGGDANGNWLTFLLLLGREDQVLQAAVPAQNLHLDYAPREDATECESGNEPYAPGQQIGNPAGVQAGAPATAPPAGATALAVRAGLRGPSR